MNQTPMDMLVTTFLLENVTAIGDLKTTNRGVLFMVFHCYRYDFLLLEISRL